MTDYLGINLSYRCTKEHKIGVRVKAAEKNKSINAATRDLWENEISGRGQDDLLKMLKSLAKSYEKETGNKPPKKVLDVIE